MGTRRRRPSRAALASRTKARSSPRPASASGLLGAPEVPVVKDPSPVHVPRDRAMRHVRSHSFCAGHPTVFEPSCRCPLIMCETHRFHGVPRADRRTNSGILCRVAHELWDFVQGGARTLRFLAQKLWDVRHCPHSHVAQKLWDLTPAVASAPPRPAPAAWRPPCAPPSPVSVASTGTLTDDTATRRSSTPALRHEIYHAPVQRERRERVC